LLSNLVHNVLDATKFRGILSFGLCGLLIYYALTPFVGRIQFTIIFYAVISVIALLRAIGGKPFIPFVKSQRLNLSILVLYMLLGVFQAVYYYSFFAKLSYESFGEYMLLEYTLAAINIVVCLHLTWYVTGLALPIIGIICILYSIFGFLVPGPFFHEGLSFTEILQYFSLLMVDGGVYGSPLQVAVTLVALFVLFAMLAQASGLLETFLKICWRIVRKSTKLLPQFAVISSMAFGMITGAAMANVAATGSFTIPLMKRHGLRSKVAGAVESVASTGGQYMPPVMGAVSFLMVEFLGVHYIEIMKAGVPLALLLYAGIFIGVHLTAGPEVRIPISRSVGEEDKRIETDEKIYAAPLSWGDGVHLFAFVCSVVVLVIAYAVFLFSVMYGAMLCIFTYLSLELLYTAVTAFRERDVRAFLRWIKVVYEGCRRAADALIVLVFLTAIVGLMIRVLYVTGASQVLGTYLLVFSGGRLIPLLLLSAVLCIFLGMVSVSITAYILVAILVAPVLVNFGIPPFVSHFFVFLLAVTSSITPPVGGGVIVASGLCGANVMQVGWTSVKLGIIFFFMPFVLIVHPQILYFNLDTLILFPLILVSTCSIVFALNLQSSKRLDYLLRFILLAAGAASALISQGFYLGLSLGVLVLVASALLYRNREAIRW